LQSDDYGCAQTGVLLAEILGLPHATIIIGIEKTDDGLHLKRELEAGHYQFIDMKMPAVLTIQSGINKLRYATLIGIKQAKMKPMRKVGWADIEAKLSKNQQEIERLYIPQKQKKTEMIQGSAGEAARKLVEYLKNEARVI
ncbi:MAG: electron transfer flavoprotein subunit beta, partial [Silvibacterium sp.]